MDIKDLNKSQLILLAVLLSFVTSIATGITTVTLMQQAPPSFTVPVNRVIQQTIEKIEQVEGKTTVKTVVVKEEDLVVDAIAKNQGAVFSLTREVIGELGVPVEISAGRGFAVSADGIVAVDASLAPTEGIYYFKNETGKFKADFLYKDASGFSLLKIGAPLDPKSKLSFVVPSFGDIGKMKIGQKILVLGASISSYIYEGKSPNLNVTKSNAGGLVINLDGEALGIALLNDSSFASVSLINEALKPSQAPKAP